MTTMTMTETAARWLRVSSGGQDEENQRPGIAAHCAARGYQDGPEYTVHARSAYHGAQQRDLDEALADARAGLYQVLVIWHSDRLERRPGKALLDVLAEFSAAGVRVESVSEPALGQLDFGGQVLTFISGLMNHEKSRHLADQVRTAHDKIRANGGVTGKAPYGFGITGEKYAKVMAPDPAEAAFIRAAAERYLSGESLRKVCAWLDDEGAAPRAGTSWSPVSLSQVFRNESLIGRRMSEPDEHGRRRTLLKHDPILDKGTWDRLQAELDRKANRIGIAPKQTALLTGIAVCAKCGGPMYRIWSGSGNQARTAYYRCHGTDRQPSKCRNMVRVSELDAWTDEQLGGNGGFVIETVVTPGRGHADEIAETERDLRELDYDEPGFLDRQAALLAERARLRALPSEPARVEEQVAPYAVGDLWRSLDPAGRRAYLLASEIKVVVSKDERRIEGDPGRVAAFGWAGNPWTTGPEPGAAAA